MSETTVDPMDYPPHKMSPAEEAATVGRFVIDQEAVPAPVLEDDPHVEAPGRLPAAPRGKVYVTNPDADSAKRVSSREAAVAAQSEAVRSATPDMVVPQEGSHLSDDQKGAKHGSFVDRKAPEVGYGALPDETVAELDAKEEERVLARQGVKTVDEQVLAEPAKPADPESVEAAFEVTHESERQATEGPIADGVDVDGKLTRSPEEQAEAVEEAEPEQEPTVLDQKIEEAAGGTVEPNVDQPSKGDAADPSAGPNYADHTVADLRAELGKRQIDYEYSARKADLIQLLEENDKK